ncbi:MAG: hypothetical protein GEU71_15430 [Actinobacteria bacterium]|nr:hypothetical protein [Actinomycetota bacterium]
MAEDPTAPIIQSATFGGVRQVPVGTTTTLLVLSGIAFKGTCAVSETDPTQNMASITVASNETGTWYSSLGLYTGDVTQIDPPDGGVVVYTYDAGCDTPGGPFLAGGIAFTIGKPSGIAMNGVMSCGVGLLGADSVFSGVVFV